MEASEFPQRLYTKGGEPVPEKSIGYYADDYRLVPALQEALREDEWEEIYESPLGVFLKFHDLDFGWASRLVHHMLTFQIVCNQRYEIWSLIGTTPVRFSLHEFEEITKLNRVYVNDLAQADLELSDEMRVFWKQLGVDVDLGPSTLEIIEVCSNCSSWSRDDRLRLVYLGIYAGFIVATKPISSTNANHARLVIDLEGFKEFQWERIAFQHLIKSVKEKDLSKNIHIEGFVQALQLWVYYALPDFAAEFGEPLSNDPTPLLLAYKRSRERKNVKANMLKQTSVIDFIRRLLYRLGGYFPVWDDEQQDLDIVKIVNAIYDPQFKFSKKHWPMEDVLGSHIVKAKTGKRSLPSDESSHKKTCTGSVSAASFVGDQGVGVVTTMKVHFDQCFKSFSTKMLNGLGSCEKQIKLLSNKVKSVECAVEELTTGTAKHTDEETNSVKEDAPKKDNVNVGASESVNTPGDAKGKKTAVDQEEAPDTRIVARAKSERNIQLAATQKNPFLGYITAKTIIPTLGSHNGHSHAGTKHASDAEIDEAVEPLAVMIPYLLQTCAPNEEKWKFLYTPFTHVRVPGTDLPQNYQSGDCRVYCLKYIEYHALDFPFPLQLCDKNIRAIREKMAA
ncbi:hypothetical protein EUTSA_v10015287mg [Eutrema salsugineum]|uniref:DUF1985 domain-containing protein n=1 Tax=Eutrema salsugineum TaxID=72664 RepID=V4L046_EUTSA|nr:hypothetical protein EUTSA_v10015287mg [Eutrema salsugineum]